MCNFISAIKTEKEYFYLTKDDLKGKRFKVFKEYNGDYWQSEVCGHGAIGFFYPDVKGEHWECKDFSSQDNFPKCIVEDIKKGNLRGIGICVGILNNKGKKKYKKIQQTAYAEYLKIKKPALAEYNKIKQSTLAEYNKINQPALAKYDKIEQSAYAEYLKIQQSAFWDIAIQRKFRNRKWK